MMPALRNHRHERFAREWHKSGNSARAYQLAFRHPDPKPWHRVSGCRLLTKANIQNRLGELQRQTIKRADITIDKVLTEYEEARLQAKSQRQPGAMIAATEKKARLCGLVVDKRQTVPGCAGIEDAKSLPELFDRLANQFGNAAALSLMSAIETISRLSIWKPLKPRATPDD